MFDKIRHFVELVLDVQSARRMEVEAQRALDRGTDPREAVQNLKRVDAETGRLGTAFRKVGLVVGAAFAVDRLKSFVGQMWELGTASEEGASKFNTTFGEAAGRVRTFLGEWATMAGLNKNLAEDFSASAGAIVQGMGASRDASAEFSEEMLRLAGDLQSFHNVPIGETFAALRSGLTGEYEPLKRFGIILSADEVALRALTETGKKHKDELSQFDLAQARLTLTMQRAGVAMGDLERTKDSDANKARRLTAEYENFKIELAEGLMPVFSELIGYLTNNRESITEGAKTAFGALKEGASQAWEVLKDVWDVLGDIRDRVRDPIRITFTFAAEFVGEGRKIARWWIEHTLGQVADVSPKGNVVYDLLLGVPLDESRAAREKRERDRATAHSMVNDVDSAGRSIIDARGTGGGAPAPGPAISATPTASEVAAAKRRAKALNDAFAEEFDRLWGGHYLERNAKGDLVPRAGAGWGFGTSLAEGAHIVRADRVDPKTGRRIMPNAPVAGLRTTPVEMPAGPPGIIVPEDRDMIGEMFDSMLGDGEHAAYALTDAFGGFFTTLFDGFRNGEGLLDSFGAATVGFGKDIIRNMTEGAAEWQMAEGAADLATGLWPPNPAALAGAAQHFAAAGLFRALGSMIGGGGGRAGVPGVSRDAGLSVARSADRAPLQVYVMIDPLDPYNPAYQRNVLAAEQFAKERYGPEAEIIVQPRTGG